jgi:hypothetical protein
LPEQFSHARVRHPLRELQTYLTELEAQATLIAPIAPARDNPPNTETTRATTQGNNAPAQETTKATRKTKK